MLVEHFHPSLELFGINDKINSGVVPRNLMLVKPFSRLHFSGDRRGKRRKVGIKSALPMPLSLFQSKFFCGLY